MGITAKGYRRLYDAASKRLRMEHDLVWERAHGPIPDGFDVHHINHDKLDNGIENLELLDRLTHGTTAAVSNVMECGGSRAANVGR